MCQPCVYDQFFTPHSPVDLAEPAEFHQTDYNGKYLFFSFFSLLNMLWISIFFKLQTIIYLFFCRFVCFCVSLEICHINR